MEVVAATPCSWDRPEGSQKWFIGFFIGEHDDMLWVDHLTELNADWKNPLHGDIQNGNETSTSRSM